MSYFFIFYFNNIFLKFHEPLKLMESQLKSVAEIAKKYGFKESESMIFLTLLLSSEPLTQKDIRRKLNYSIGLISTSLTSLEKKGIIRVIKEGKVKKYDAIASFNLLFSNLIEQILKTDVAYVLNIIKDFPNEKIKRLIKKYNDVSKKSALIKEIVTLDEPLLKRLEECLKGEKNER